MNLMRKYFLCAMVVLLLAAANETHAQGDPTVRKFGLTASIQGNQAIILIPIWVADTITLAPGFSLWYVDGGTTTLDLLISPRFYFRMDRVAPYFGGRLGARIQMPDVGDTIIDWIGGVSFGGEYFVNPMFSFGVEGQMNIMLFDSPAAGAADFEIHSVAAVHANVYF